jgi:hypothetical protein
MGEDLEPPSSSLPIHAPSYELHPVLIAMVREKSFSGAEEENTYTHLRGFEEVCPCLVIRGMSHERLKWKLFPFSLTEIAKKWYTQTVRGAKGHWEVLRNKFCLAFFPESRLVDLRMEVLGFKQKEKETLGAAWAQFLDLNMSGPNLELSELMLLQHFRRGLSKESAQSLDISSGGAFTHLTPSEGRNILNEILENTPYTSVFDEFPEEEVDGILKPENDILLSSLLLTPKFGKESDLWVQLDEESVWRKEGFFRCIRQKDPRSAICFRSAREQ